MHRTSAEWLDEVDLDPRSTWRSMGTRALAGRPWLLPDHRRTEELAIKDRLLTERPAEVFAASSASADSGRETLALVESECSRLGLEPVIPMPDGLHPLDRAGRLVQEDLCLLRRAEVGWVFDAATLCFPSRWRLADKLGRSQGAVHGPVEGYRGELSNRVDRLFDRLGERIVWRRNWFVHPDPALFQPDRPIGGDPVVPADHALTGLYVRSERQTLRRLPETGWILFTIRTQQEPVVELLLDEDRRVRFSRYLDDAPLEQLAHRGLSSAQIAELRLALAR